MPVDLDPVIDAEKNRDESTSPWLWFLDWTFSREWTPPGLVAHWKLDDNLATTAVIDWSGNSNHATLAGGDNTEDLNTTGKIYDAFQFNGTDDVNDCGDPFESTFQGSFSISLWARPDDGQPAAAQFLLGTLDATGNDSLVQLRLNTNGRLIFNYEAEGNNGNPAETASAVFANGAASGFIHIVIVFDSTIGGVGGKRIYVGAVPQSLDGTGDGDTSGVTAADYTSSENLYVGAFNNDGAAASFFDGALDDVMFFKRALSAADVKRLFDLGNDQSATQTERLVNNNADLTYQSNLYTKCNFALGPWESVAGGALPRRTLSTSNADLVKVVYPYVLDYNGLVDSVIVATPVFAGALDIDMSAKAIEYTVISTSVAEDSIAFVLGAANPLQQPFPSGKYYADHCWYVKHFNSPSYRPAGVECGYSGADTTCDGTYLDCFTKANQHRFGGQVALRARTLRLA